MDYDAEIGDTFTPVIDEKNMVNNESPYLLWKTTFNFDISFTVGSWPGKGVRTLESVAKN